MWVTLGHLMVRDHWVAAAPVVMLVSFDLILRSVLAVLSLLDSVLPSSETAGILPSVPKGFLLEQHPKAQSDCLPLTAEWTVPLCRMHMGRFGQNNLAETWPASVPELG